MAKKKKDSSEAQVKPPKPPIPNAPIFIGKDGKPTSNDKGIFDIDKWNNKTIIDGNIIKIHLAKEGYKRSRKIFTIDAANKRLICERDYSMHRFIKLNAYGFNHTVLSKAKSSTHVLLKEVRYDQVFYYNIPIEHILRYGTIQHHMKVDNYELQVFLNLEWLENNFRISKEEAKF